jgi:hypothetical protein
VQGKQTPLNVEIIEGNLLEAIEELKKIRARALNGELNEGEFQVGLCHAYHHLNFAWNIRHVETSRYAHLTQADFDRWGKYPPEIEDI